MTSSELASIDPIRFIAPPIRSTFQPQRPCSRVSALSVNSARSVLGSIGGPSGRRASRLNLEEKRRVCTRGEGAVVDLSPRLVPEQTDETGKEEPDASPSG